MIKLYSDLAERVAQTSNAKRLKVGCIIVKNDNIISFSWNGTPPNWETNICEDITCDINGYPSLITKKEVMHAEENALTKIAKSNISCDNANMFCTHSPCFNCAKLIVGSGIKFLYYKRNYRSPEGLEFLKKCNVELIKGE